LRIVASSFLICISLHSSRQIALDTEGTVESAQAFLHAQRSQLDALCQVSHLLCAQALNKSEDADLDFTPTDEVGARDGED
jgi:hypothetical protein